MSAFDIAIIVFLFLPALIGVIYGFLNIIFSLLSWAIALGISIKFMPYFAPLLASYVETELIRSGLAFIGLFVISLILLSLLGYFFIKLLGRTGLTAADRILGLFFGMALGISIISVIISLAGFTLLPAEQWWQQSKLVDPFERIGIWCNQFLPESISQYHSFDV